MGAIVKTGQHGRRGAILTSPLGTVCNTVPTSFGRVVGAVRWNGLRFDGRRSGSGCSAALLERSAWRKVKTVPGWRRQARSLAVPTGSRMRRSSTDFVQHKSAGHSESPFREPERHYVLAETWGFHLMPINATRLIVRARGGYQPR
ncbi:MAG: hypothetical protein R3F19_18140 [Verrucomicrobiales bacterium]